MERRRKLRLFAGVGMMVTASVSAYAMMTGVGAKTIDLQACPSGQTISVNSGQCVATPSSSTRQSTPVAHPTHQVVTKKTATTQPNVTKQKIVHPTVRPTERPTVVYRHKAHPTVVYRPTPVPTVIVRHIVHRPTPVPTVVVQKVVHQPVVKEVVHATHTERNVRVHDTAAVAKTRNTCDANYYWDDIRGRCVTSTATYTSVDRCEDGYLGDDNQCYDRVLAQNTVAAPKELPSTGPGMAGAASLFTIVSSLLAYKLIRR
jgi:hypothetical protein